MIPNRIIPSGSFLAAVIGSFRQPIPSAKQAAKFIIPVRFPIAAAFLKNIQTQL
jgi:hypothetical protein